MLTKDEIDALMPKPYRASGQQMSYDGYDKAHCHLFSIGQVHSVVSDAIAAHTAKVLEDVEPVGYIHPEDIKNIAVSDVEHCEIYSKPFSWDGAVYLPLYPAHTVAALAARVAELEKDAEQARTEPDLDTLRTDFHKWCATNGYKPDFVQGGECPMGRPVYADHKTHAAWWAFQKAAKLYAAPLLTHKAEDAPSDQVIEVAGALEVRRILEVIKDVARLRPPPAGDMPSPFDAAWQTCCEEIFYRATGCRWHMDEDAERFGRAAIAQERKA